ncbi:hypothetical protein [Staphylococcus simulans]|nr:hypothetical protein [Staphylococcus simulans]UXV41796.1 hypothetical protein MUA12_09845 [Staphylococcus simulans]
MNNSKERIYFYIDSYDVETLNEHVEEWDSLYKSRTQFIIQAIKEKRR